LFKALSKFYFLISVFGGSGILNSGLFTYKAGALQLEPHLHSFQEVLPQSKTEIKVRKPTKINMFYRNIITLYH
jgi:hypothetical protein